jgi:hypothetical protein
MMEPLLVFVTRRKLPLEQPFENSIEENHKSREDHGTVKLHSRRNNQYPHDYARAIRCSSQSLKSDIRTRHASLALLLLPT